ncbi:unnamed protein product, partial [Rhizoctonia solani]
VDYQPIFKSPKGVPANWTLASLRQHLQTAVLLELYTIPLYLFCMYSIDVSDGMPESAEQNAVHDIQEIVKQEMLHLALAGNLLTAVRGRPHLYGEAYAPKYPSEVLYEGVPMTLAPANPYQLQNFVEIEQPVDEKMDQDETLDNWTLAEYHSIGHFYDSLKRGLEELHGRLGDDIFDKDSEKRQWSGGFGGELTPISDLETAKSKLDLIIQQGEGGPRPSGSAEYQGDSHYEVFKRLKEQKLKVHNLVPNPRTKHFEKKEHSYPVMLAFDAAYSYLLWTIEAVWTYGGPDESKKKKLRKSIGPLMSAIMRPIAQFLVFQDLKTIKKKRAAPPFNLYIFPPGVSPKEQLLTLLGNAATAYPNAPELKDLTAAASDLFDLGEI